jgi:uncharacterized OB-fold protein
MVAMIQKIVGNAKTIKKGMKKKMYKILQKIYWFLMGDCTQCGGFVEVYSIKQAYCIECGAKN